MGTALLVPGLSEEVPLPRRRPKGGPSVGSGRGQVRPRPATEKWLLARATVTSARDPAGFHSKTVLRLNVHSVFTNSNAKRRLNGRFHVQSSVAPSGARGSFDAASCLLPHVGGQQTSEGHISVPQTNRQSVLSRRDVRRQPHPVIYETRPLAASPRLAKLFTRSRVPSPGVWQCAYTGITDSRFPTEPPF